MDSDPSSGEAGTASEARELLDVLDADGRPTGECKARAAVHRNGDWHASVHVWIVKDGRQVLLQRRAAGKDLSPGRVDVSVGGHLASGELPIDMVREVEEELGVVARFQDLVSLGRFRSERRYAHAIDREFQDVFLLFDDRPLQEYAPHPAEVEVLYEVPLERAVALWRDGAHVPAAGWDAQGRRNDALLIETDLAPEARADLARELEAVLAAVRGGPLSPR